MTHPTSPAPASVVDSLTALADELGKLGDDMKTFESGRRHRDRVLIGVTALLVLGVAVLGVVAWQSNRVVKQSSATFALLVDCTVEGGECRKRSAASTGRAIQELDDRDGFGNIAIVQCSRDLGPGSDAAWDAAFEKCVFARKAALAKKYGRKK